MERPHFANVCLWVLGALRELESVGMITGYTGLTQLGVSEFDQLDASGFRPTDTEIVQSLQFIGGFLPEAIPSAVILIMSFRDRREHLYKYADRD